MQRAITQVFAVDLLSKIILGGVGLLLIRYMPPGEFAAFTLVASLVSIVAQALGASFNRIYILGQESLGTDISASTFLGFQLWILLAASIASLPFAHHLDSLYAVAVALAFAMVLSDFAKTFFQRQLRFLRFSAIELARSLLIALFVAGLIQLYGFALTASQALAAQAIALWLVFAVVFARHLEPRKLLDLATAGKTLSRVVSGQYAFLFGYFFVLALFSQADVLMLKLLADDVELATFGSAARYYALLSLALNAVHAVLLPTIQQVKSREDLDALFDKHMTMLYAFCPLVILGAWLSQWIIPWVDFGKYPGAVDVFRILSASSIISFAFSPHVNLVMRFERFRFLFVLISGGLIINTVGNAVLIPTLGAQGAAVATLVAAASVTVPIFLLSRRLRLSMAGSPAVAGP